MTKAEATKKANTLLSKMNTDGWKIRVHENAGWHYALQNGPLQLYEYPAASGKTYYVCLVGTENDAPGGLSMWTESDVRALQSSRDPNKCVKRAVRVAHSVMKSLADVLRPSFEAYGLKIAAIG